jgi:hypothetical protein
MKKPGRVSFECLVSVAASLVSVIFLVFFALHAGGLWRDEANTFNLAALPYGELWLKMQYDSFPLIWPLVFGFAQKIGFQGDLGLRILGIFILLLLLGCLWYNARRLNYKSPLIAVTLFMLSPCLIIWGSSIRAWGFGLVFSSLIYTFTIRYVFNTNFQSWISLLLICLFGAHSLYYNTLVIFVCLSSGAVCLYVAGHQKQSAMTLLIGIFTAVSMIVYIPTINRIGEWNVSVKTDYNLNLFCAKIYETLSPGGAVALLAWGLVVPVCIVLAGRYLIKKNEDEYPNEKYQILYSFLILALIIPIYYVFLKKLSYLTQPWYYLVLLLVVSLAADTILGTLSKIHSIKIARNITACLLFVMALSVVPGEIFIRLTNVDLFSNILNKEAKAQDLVLVYPWYEGITFKRYYHGGAPWQTIPEISDHKLHRYDLIKKHMINPNQADVLRSTYTDINRTLKANKKVFLLGEPIFPQQGHIVPVLPPAPSSPAGWQDTPYCMTWCMQVSDYLIKHAKSVSKINEHVIPAVSKYESASLFVFEGWKDE